MLRRAFLSMIAFVVVALVAGAIFMMVSHHRQKAQLPIAAVQGPQPRITDPRTSPIPLVRIARPIGWKAGEMPTPGAGLEVRAFATGLDHPRWLLVLPNGDVLVAESDAPPKPDDNVGIKGWIAGKIVARAGAGRPSPNRIVLLRDSNGDGVADKRSVLLSGLNSPFGMALVGRQLYVADTDALLRFPFTPGETT